MTPAPRLIGRLLAAMIAATGVVVPVGLTMAPSAAAAGCPAPGGTTIPAAVAPVGAEIAFLGHGYGHSLGMSQYGAQGAARLGCTHPTILSTYYRGSLLTTKTMPTEMRTWMLVDGTHATVFADNGSVNWNLSGCAAACPPTQPQGSTWRMRTDSAKSYFDLTDMATGLRVWKGGAPGATVTAAHNGTVIGMTSYRGSAVYLSRRLRYDELRFTLNSSGLDAVQVIKAGHVAPLGRTVSAMDKYLWGVAEVPLSWTRDAHEALRAQVVAARTYAWAKVSSGMTTLYPTTVNQHYTGYDKEREDTAYRDQHGRNLRWADAIRTTTGKVLVTSSGNPVNTFFTSSTGGHSEDTKYVWGNSSMSYIAAIDDSTWDAASSGSTYRSWARGYTKADVASRLGFDTVTSVSVAPQGTADRLLGVRVTGIDNGVATTRHLAGDTVRQKLGLPSPGFVVAMQQAPVRATVPGRVPAVTAVGGAAGGSATIAVKWTGATSGGSPITSYRVRAVRYDSAGAYMITRVFPVPPSARSYTAVLDSGWYAVDVQAVNAIGGGQWSPRTGLRAAR